MIWRLERCKGKRDWSLDDFEGGLGVFCLPGPAATLSISFRLFYSASARKTRRLRRQLTRASDFTLVQHSTADMQPWSGGSSQPSNPVKVARQSFIVLTRNLEGRERGMYSFEN